MNTHMNTQATADEARRSVLAAAVKALDTYSHQCVENLRHANDVIARTEQALADPSEIDPDWTPETTQWWRDRQEALLAEFRRMADLRTHEIVEIELLKRRLGGES